MYYVLRCMRASCKAHEPVVIVRVDVRNVDGRSRSFSVVLEGIGTSHVDITDQLRRRIDEPAPHRPMMALVDDLVLGWIRSKVAGTEFDHQGAEYGSLVSLFAIGCIPRDPCHVPVGFVVPDIHLRAGVDQCIPTVRNQPTYDVLEVALVEYMVVEDARRSWMRENICISLFKGMVGERPMALARICIMI